jgi:NAD(P)-dependent dehydrogenase (short-subunit alcohol dehydrogenase family)
MGILDGKVAVITGAGHGVGRGYALAMAAAGAKVVVNDLGGSPAGEGGDATAADEVVKLIEQNGGEAIANSADVADFEQSAYLVDQAFSSFGSLDVLVLNAGILRDKMIFNMDEADWDAVVRVHLKGHFAPARHASVRWRSLTKATGRPVNASVICTTSLVGLLGNVGQTNYVAAKGGVAMFTVALAQDLERYGVRANCIAPSGTTRLIATMPGHADDRVVEPDEYTGYSASDPGNVAPLAVWLGSDLSMHVSGQAFFSHGASITHFEPWTPGAVITVPGGVRKWEPEEVGKALNTKVFLSRHPGLRQGAEFVAGA